MTAIKKSILINASVEQLETVLTGVCKDGGDSIYRQHDG